MEQQKRVEQQTGWRGWVVALFGRLWRDGNESVPPHLRKPFIRRRWRTTELQFAHGVSQSRMLTLDPDKLLIDYTRTMLGALVLVPRPRIIGMIGLGGGSQAKFCYRHLPEAQIEIVENNPHVLALRGKFRVPDDDARFRVILDDGANFLRMRKRHFDLLLVDGYDETGIPPALSSQQFYDDCRASLTDRGAMAVNLYCDDAQNHIERLRRSFGARHVLIVEEPRQSNRVALAWVGTPASAASMALSPVAQRELAFEFARLRAMGLGGADC
jgi:spermidine synthase